MSTIYIIRKPVTCKRQRIVGDKYKIIGKTFVVMHLGSCYYRIASARTYVSGSQRTNSDNLELADVRVEYLSYAFEGGWEILHALDITYIEKPLEEKMYGVQYRPIASGNIYSHPVLEVHFFPVGTFQYILSEV